MIRYPLLLAVLISYAYSEIDAAAGHMVEALPPRDIGKELYEKHCISCHKKDKSGIKKAPLNSHLLKKYQIKDLIALLQKGCRGNPYSPYNELRMYELVKVSRYITKSDP